MKRIQSKKHKTGTYEINIISLSVFDDKRFVLNDGIHTLAYFHRELRKQILTDDRKKKRFKKILTNDQRFTQLKISAYKTNKFLTGGLIGVHVSSIIYELNTISSQLIFFYEKILNAQKRKPNQNQLTK